MSPKRLIPISLLAVSGLALAGCATDGTDAGETDSDTLTVVASTNVYGQIVEEIAGDGVEVVSIIDSETQDPHSYEPSAQDQLRVSEADLIIENGGGYDAYIDSMIESSGAEAPVITAAEFSHDYPSDEESEEEHDHSEDEEHTDEESEDEHEGHDHIEGFNEHVWYDPHTMEHVAEEIAHELGELDPDNAETYEENAATFISGIEDLEAELDATAAEYSGEGVFVTEPVPVYLTTAAGLENLTPEAFSEAVEEGQDVPAATLLEAIDLIESGDVSVVITNTQTAGAETEQVVSEADAGGIPVIQFAETLPEGETYLSWMQLNIDALNAALAE